MIQELLLYRKRRLYIYIHICPWFTDCNLKYLCSCITVAQEEKLLQLADSMVDRPEWYDSLPLFFYRLFCYFMLEDFEYLKTLPLLKTVLPQDELRPYLVHVKQFLISHHVQKTSKVSCFELISQWPKIIWSWYPSTIFAISYIYNTAIYNTAIFAISLK